MNDELTTINENPYQSPLTGGQDALPARTAYPSVTSAVLAGAWRGAKFGGKWMALSLGSLLLIVLVAVCGTIVYEMSWRGYDGKRVLEGLEGVGWCVLALMQATLLAAAVGAIIMGIGEGISYWRGKRGDAITTTP
jgi:hypothetical protein